MIKQLIIDGKKSYDDFGVYIASRNISSPKKKSVKETVPFSNVTYDFSKIDGEIYWEERPLQYSFDIAEISTEKMEEVKSQLQNWLLNVHDADIFDPYIGDFHFHGSYESDSWSEDFGAGTITVSFNVYPYKISNDNIETTISAENNEKEIVINNDSAHRIKPILTSTGSVIIKFGNKNYTISDGTYVSAFYLEPGKNEITVTGNGNLTFSSKIEVF